MPITQLAPDTPLDSPRSASPPVKVTQLPAGTQLDQHPSALSRYIQGSLESIKGIGKEVGAGARDIGQAMVPGMDPRPGFEWLKEIGMFASGGLTSPIGPQRSGPLARADRARMGNPPPPKSVSVDEFLKKAAPAGEKKPGPVPSMSVSEIAHLLHAVLKHDPLAIARILGKKYLSDRD